jgi:hypothetical protein
MIIEICLWIALGIFMLIVAIFVSFWLTTARGWRDRE